jgi:hypothetical protein
MSGPAKGHERRGNLFRMLLPCLALGALDTTSAQAQTVTPDLFNPVRGGFVSPRDLPLRKTADNAADNTGDAGGDPSNRQRGRDQPAPSRIGQIPTYGLPAASGAKESGYDSLNRRRKPPKFYPGQLRPRPPPGPEIGRAHV